VGDEDFALLRWQFAERQVEGGEENAAGVKLLSRGSDLMGSDA